jgi:hypothetical protein
MSRLFPILALGLATVALTQPAAADTLRCGSSLVQVGDPLETVLKKCGEPTSRQTITEPVWARGLNGNVYQTGTTESQVWRYDRGPRKFPARLKIAEGVVQSIDFEKSPGQHSEDDDGA